MTRVDCIKTTKDARNLLVSLAINIFNTCSTYVLSLAIYLEQSTVILRTDSIILYENIDLLHNAPEQN